MDPKEKDSPERRVEHGKFTQRAGAEDETERETSPSTDATIGARVDPMNVDDVELEEGEVGEGNEAGHIVEEGEVEEKATKSPKPTTGRSHDAQDGVVKQTAPSEPRRPDVPLSAGARPGHAGSAALRATKSLNHDEAPVHGGPTSVMRPPTTPSGPRGAEAPAPARAIPTGPRASVAPGTPRAIPTGPRADRERAFVPGGTPSISVGNATPRTPHAPSHSTSGAPPNYERQQHIAWRASGSATPAARAQTHPTPRAQNDRPQSASIGKRARSPSPRADSPHPQSSSKRLRWGENQTKFEPVTYTPDPMGVQISNLQQAVKEKDAKIESLEWQLARARATLHQVKKYGNSRVRGKFCSVRCALTLVLQDMSRVERTARKYYFMNTESAFPSDLSEVSDEESGGNAPYLVPAAGNEEFYSILADADAEFYEATALDEQVEGEPEHPDAVDQAARIDERSAKAATSFGSLDTFIDHKGLQLEEDVKSGPDHTKLYAKLFNLHSDGTYLPAPVGRFGQPFWKGSSWEDFDPNRLFFTKRNDFVSVESPQFRQMALDAARIPFRYRSETQRMVVSWALIRNIPIVEAGLTPEPDILTMCRSNSSYLPPVIRRQYRRNVKAVLYYVEYCAVDLEHYARLVQAGPRKTSSASDHKAERSGWLKLLGLFVEWLPQNWRTLPTESPRLYKGGIPPWNIQLSGREWQHHEMLELYEQLWMHLRRCGYNDKEILPGGELYEYLVLSTRLFICSHSLTEEYKQDKPDGAKYNQQQLRAWVADRLPYQPIPATLPRVRIRLSRERADRLQKKYKTANQSLKYNFLMV